MNWEMMFVRFDCGFRYVGTAGAGVAVTWKEGASLEEILLTLLSEGWEPFYYIEGSPEYLQVGGSRAELRGCMGEYGFKRGIE